MGLNQPAQRRRDRDRARAWLARHPDHLARALRLTFALPPGAAVQPGLPGNLDALRSLAGGDRWLAQGVAALLVGERWVRPVPTPASGQERPGQYSRTGVLPLGPVTLTRPGLEVLVGAGHPVGHPGSAG